VGGGGAIGAKIGALIGTVFGPVGTVIGGGYVASGTVQFNSIALLPGQDPPDAGVPTRGWTPGGTAPGSATLGSGPTEG
jgi:hypothetical protein